MFGIGIGDDTLCLIAQCELGVAQERLVGSGDETARHLQDRLSGSGRDACGQFLGWASSAGSSGSDMTTSGRSKFPPTLKATPN
jgi:hypothetical protein